MAKYEIPDKIQVPQSVGPFTNGNSESDILGVFEPEQGRDLIYLNPLCYQQNDDLINATSLLRPVYHAHIHNF